jgi:hypothetical protein
MSAPRSPTCTRSPAPASVPSCSTSRIHPAVSRGWRWRRAERCSWAGAGTRRKGCCARQPSTVCVAGTTASTLWSQHPLEPAPSSFALADWAQTSHPGVRGQVKLRRILHQQDHRFRLRVQTRLLPMRLQQRCKAHRWFIEQSVSVHGLQLFPGTLLLGQRARRITGPLTGGLDGAAGAPLLSQQCLPKGLLCPLLCSAQWAEQSNCVASSNHSVLPLS